MKDIEISPQKFVSLANIVSKEFTTEDIKEKQKPSDYGIRPKRKVIGKKLIITVTTTDGENHRIEEPYSSAAYPLLYPELTKQ